MEFEKRFWHLTYSVTALFHLVLFAMFCFSIKAYFKQVDCLTSGH